VFAKIPRETTKTKDITGGLPRVVELFETRKPKDPRSSAKSTARSSTAYCQGMRKVYVESHDGKTTKEYSSRAASHHVQEATRQGREALIDGPLNLHDLLAFWARSSRNRTWSTPFRRFTGSGVNTTTSTSRHLAPDDAWSK